MARPIVLSNGNMQVGINLYGMVHDFYYPYVGLENHSTANNMRHRIGVWAENRFSWLDDGTWEFTAGYPDKSLIGLTTAYNADFGITLQLQDCVDADHDAFLRNIHVINQFDRAREVRIFLHQVFRISNSFNGDTAQYLPGEPAILHYKGHRAFVVGADHNGRSFDQFSVGIYGIEGKEGTYRDAEDGVLSGNTVEHGSVDSVIGFNLHLGKHDSTRVTYWIAAGRSQHEAINVHRKIKASSVFSRQQTTQDYWHQWLKPAETFIATLDVELQAPFRNSLLIVKSHIDKHGAVIASTDTTMRNYSRDAYAYCWPRDAAYALWPLLRLGYRDEVKAFFYFCRHALHPDGYLLHKYQADGAPGSSWHPYIVGDRPIAPIQEDETAITLFLFGQYYEATQDLETLKEFYDSFIRPAAGFMANYIDEATKLPFATYDLWEEKFLTTTYTCSLVYASLLTCAKLAEAMQRDQDAVRWQTVAEDIKVAAQDMLFNKDKQFFYKGFVHQTTTAGHKEIMYDDTIDMSSFYGAFMFGLFDLEGEAVKKAYHTVTQTFRVTENAVTPLPRYLHDQYRITEEDSLGNPWFVTTLWLGQYYTETGKQQMARQIIDWTSSRMLKSGVLSEQINPYTHKFISVAPLVWSQAEFLNSVLDLSSSPMQLVDEGESYNHNARVTESKSEAKAIPATTSGTHSAKPSKGAA